MGNSPRGQLNREELVRSIRDTVLIGMLMMGLDMLEIFSTGDYGAYGYIIQQVCIFGTAIINRWLNIIRI